MWMGSSEQHGDAVTDELDSAPSAGWLRHCRTASSSASTPSISFSQPTQAAGSPPEEAAEGPAISRTTAPSHDRQRADRDPAARLRTSPMAAPIAVLGYLRVRWTGSVPAPWSSW
jgi:hypothetical protein